ncbi:hypothetical protein SDRG_13397 [Saprolegnia diclina VS20]|uniref:Uncharacterized protein n=1 Tax=Saprolegnia diclina (strain VS20) TaxID=1156394 RepID=T0RGM9_SAPDV|nr:hypothetical protein SDRG_13397 [Saprolegnia diclina VS20]EQC28887.1 hypothetical protein SDRG_13397 [Saprolegnia diclina VS20]|eukprot:XP_008617704.1 hypothetical protein SDRG_13397 [Saprolegnia diclina VS20]
MLPSTPAIVSTPTNDPTVAFASIKDVDNNNQVPRKSSRLRLIIGAIVFCGVVCASVGAYYIYDTKVRAPSSSIVSLIQSTPGLRLTLHAKRSSMAINGQTTLQVYVVPRSSASASGSLQFDALLSTTGDEVTDTYMLLNQRAYHRVSKNDLQVSASCLDQSRVPPVELMQSSLESATIVDSVNGSTATNCTDGKLLHLTFAGEDFAFCSSPTHQLTRATGTDLDMDIEYLSDASQLPSFDVPVVDGAALDCPVLVPSVAAASGQTLLQTSTSIWKAATGAPRILGLGSSSCGCSLEKMKPCLFVHGVGHLFSAPMTNTYLFDWGLIHKHAPCCSSTKFVHFEMWQRGWDNDDIQNEFCDAALSVSKSTTKTIEDLILVTYSMGNLITGSAVAKGKCNLSNKVTWVSIAGPMQGSLSGNLLEQKCQQGGGNLPLKGLLEITTLCPITDAFLKLKHETTVSPAIKANFLAAQAVRKQYATVLMCGSDSFGLSTIFGPVMKLVSALTKHGDMNDGVVAFESCRVGFEASSFSNNYADGGNYLASVNHFDNSFRNGDGWWGADRKPQKWFECVL